MIQSIIKIIKGAHLKFSSLKKIFDLIFSILLLIILFPLFILISLIVFFETGKNPLFIQERGLTLTNKRFRIYKFRTFKQDDSKRYNKKAFLLKRKGEELVTFSGRFLRKSGLDEIPQIINIIKGEMSLIGPRPLSLDDLEVLKKFYPEYYKRRDEASIKPGLSGLWQINKGEDYSVHKLGELEKTYLQERSFVYDMILLLKTFKVVIIGKHKDAIIKNIFKNELQKNSKLKTKYL